MQVTPPGGPEVSVFAEAISALTGDDQAPVLLAVSGGPDSLAMLLLAKAAIPHCVQAATVDHQLRPESVDEAAFVASVCQSIGVPHATLVPDEPIIGTLQANARLARYQLLERHADKTGCGWIVTAHHADDQLETMLMRLARGSGIDGLSGIRARQGRIIRPLLAFRKAALEAICDNTGVPPINDPSNSNADFDRVAVRQWLAGTEAPIDPLRAVRSAAALADGAEALSWMAGQLAETRLHHENGAVRLDPVGLPRELRRRLLAHAISHFQPDYVSRGDAMDRALVALAAGQRLTLGNTLLEGGDSWHIRPAPPRRPQDGN